MAYIIAHGTVNGYQKIQVTSNACGSELQVLTDIRAEFDNTATMLSKPAGYILQMSPSGVWVSVVKTLMDGERSGNGAGFFAFSAFISQNEVVSGDSLKEQLDKLMQHYIGLCPNFMTKNIGVDWSFVTNASAELNAICQPRRKAINTNYTPSNNFAHVLVTTEEQIIQLLDKPFQPEYGAYKAVFIGTHLQHPMRLTQQTCLNIDLENEEYDILWNGNKHEWPDLPTKVRKKEINSGSYTFEKKYYNPTTVSYLSRDRDDANTTLILEVPNLQPQINQITLQYNHPEAVIGVAIPHLPLEQIKGSVLFFKGEEFAHEWEVMPLICGNYKCDKFSFTPCDCQNGIYPVNIIKMQQIFLQILQDGSIQTKQWFDSIDIRNIKTNKKIEKRPLGNDISILIGAEEDFLQNYIVTFSGNGYRISNPQFAGNTFYHISIIKNENSTTKGKESPTRKVYLELSKKIEVNQLSATINGRNISIDTHSSFISIEKQEHRKNIKFSYNGLPLKSRNKDQDRIKLTLTLWGFIKLNLKPILLVTSIALLLSLLVFYALILFKGIDIKGLFADVSETECFDPERADNGTPVTPTTDTKTITEDQRLYNELDSILKIQREQWNYRTITDLVGKYNNTTVIEDNHIAYSLYKELVWMQCRRRLDGDESNGDYNTWISLIKNKGIDSNNKEFATSDLYDFLNGIVFEKNKEKQKQFFENYVKTKEVEKKTFSEVKHLWDNFIPSPEQPPKNPEGGSKKTPPQSAQQPILNPE